MAGQKSKSNETLKKELNKKNMKKKKVLCFPHRESNPGRLGENQES